MSKLPPPRKLQPIVTAITEWLAALACGRAAPPPRTWSPTEWRYARAIAHIQGIAPLLHVRGAGSLGDGAWRDFLRLQYERNGQRNVHVLNIVERLRAASVQFDVPLVFLKGASLITWLYDDIALRPMSDIDVLTRPDALEEAILAIRSAGFVQADGVARHVTFILPPNTVVDMRGEHPDNPIKLELHPRISNTLPRQTWDITALFQPVLQHAPAGRPCHVTEFIHLLQHASYHAMTRALRLVGLYDLYLYSARLDVDEWRAVIDTLRQLEGLGWAYPPLALCQRYFGGIPASAIDATQKAAPAHLVSYIQRASLTQVSYCNVVPQYAMHPTKWARTFTEGMLYLSDVLLGRGVNKESARHKTSKAVHAFAPKQSYYRRGLRWFNPRAYRVGIEQLFGE